VVSHISRKTSEMWGTRASWPVQKAGHSFLDLPQASQPLGMTKGRVGFPVGIGLRDPRSQKRDLGHPSISPFDIAEGTSFVISLPTRLSESAAPNDTERADDRSSAAPTALGFSSGSISQPFPGWADVWRSALRALHLWRSLPCHFSLNLPQASQPLGMTKRKGQRFVTSGC
jgi:hypothetical protein